MNNLQQTDTTARSLDLVHADEFILVLNKPAGLLSVPGRGADKTDSLATRAQQAFPDALVVHRLDMSTSGLLVMARGKEMQRRLSRLFCERKINKNYIAVVRGQLKGSAGEIEFPLMPDWPNRPKQKVDFSIGKYSLTRYRLLASDAHTNTSRIELEPVTGRTHQLRVHMSAIGHPVLGDALYDEAACSNTGRLRLHARMLGFAHPHSEKPLTFVSEPDF